MIQIISKLLLRQGIQYSGGKAWTVAHDTWLRSQRFELVALQAAFDADGKPTKAAEGFARKCHDSLQGLK